jgi:hypothetical protein
VCVCVWCFVAYAFTAVTGKLNHFFYFFFLTPRMLAAALYIS